MGGEIDLLSLSVLPVEGYCFGVISKLDMLKPRTRSHSRFRWRRGYKPKVAFEFLLSEHKSNDWSHDEPIDDCTESKVSVDKSRAIVPNTDGEKFLERKRTRSQIYLFQHLYV